jgi:general secretion pathway protein H
MKVARGFTLIEVMVVLTIIALVATTLTLSISARREGDDDLERLRLVLEAAAERAQIRGTPLAVDFLPQGYRFSIFDTRGYWTPIESEPLFAEQTVAAELVWRGLRVNGQVAPMTLVFGSAMPAFDLTIGSKEGDVHLLGQPTGNVRRVARPELAS